MDNADDVVGIISSQINLKVQEFKARRNGRIPAIALGEVEKMVDPKMLDFIEVYKPRWCTIIEGLGYEQMFPDPHVHPVKLAEDFAGVTWKGQFNVAERYDLPLARALDDEDGALNIIQECAKVITSVYTSVWNTFRNYRLRHRYYSEDDMPKEDKNLCVAMSRFRNDEHWKLRGVMEQSDNLPDFIPRTRQLGEDLLVCFLSGFRFHQDYAMLSFLKASIPNLKGMLCFTVPAKTSRKDLAQGVPHCLVYGHAYQFECENPSRDRARYMCRDIRFAVNDKGSWSRSRRCSPRDDDDESDEFDENGRSCYLTDDLERRKDGTIIRSMEDVRTDPDDALIAPYHLLSKYVECHRPDIVCMQQTPDRGIEIKLVVQITSVEPPIIDSALQCVWSCLASLQEGQTEIMGLCCCIEGFKLLKIVKNDGHFRISETDLVLFKDYDQVVRLLSTINGAL